MLMTHHLFFSHFNEKWSQGEKQFRLIVRLLQFSFSSTIHNKRSYVVILPRLLQTSISPKLIFFHFSHWNWHSIQSMVTTQLSKALAQEGCHLKVFLILSLGHLGRKTGQHNSSHSIHLMNFEWICKERELSLYHFK